MPIRSSDGLTFFPRTVLGLSAAVLGLLVVPAQAVEVPLANAGFETNTLANSGDFKGNSTGSADPLNWVRVVRSNDVVGVIGETRFFVLDTPDGLAWLHLQNTSTTSPADPPRIGQPIGALTNALFTVPTQTNLWIHFLASRRLNENTTIRATASLYAVPAGATNWEAGTLISSALFATNLAILTEGDPGSLAQAVLKLNLNNTAAQAAQPGGDYWLVLASSLASAGVAGQLHLDRVDAQTGGETDPGPIIPPQPPISAGDHVDGNLILLNDNGGWCWYQDERIIVDRTAGRLVVGSAANYFGYGGESRDGDLDVTTFDPRTGGRTLFTLVRIPTLGFGDDHNTTALWQRPDGRYYAIYTGHLFGSNISGEGTVAKSFHRRASFAGAGAWWDSEIEFVWPANDTTSPINNDVTYNNPFFVAAEGVQGRLYNISRAADRSPNIAYSDDFGETWTYGGKLSTSTTGSSYSNGYFVFATDGTNRIHFFCTEHHPHDYNNSIYHGYIANGKSYNSFGVVVDTNIFDEIAPAPQEFTPVWVASGVTSSSYHHGWTMEIEIINGVVYGLFTSRYGTAQTQDQAGDGDHRLFYARFAGSSWFIKELCKMGDGLHTGQKDYTGLGSIHPNNPNLIYVSTEFDPRDNTPLAKHEIFKGLTTDQGTNWIWTAVTINSTVENLRPIIPAWDASHTVVCWLRGVYPHQRKYDESPVCLVEQSDEHVALVSYLNATNGNTSFTDGSPFTATGPSETDGAADGQWHQRTGFGNGGSVLAANELGAEDAPALRTTATNLADGTYDVFAYFWSRPGEDWRLRAGFTTSNLLVFRRYSCQQAEPSQFDAPVSTIDTERALYRAYVGRRTVTNGTPIEVFIDDFQATATAGTQRTVYDGIGVARVLPILHVASGQTVNATAGTYASIHNEGTLVANMTALNTKGNVLNDGLLYLVGDRPFTVDGSFTNRGVIDVIHWDGSLPAGLVNPGVILDRSTVQTDALFLSGRDVWVTIGGHVGHTYQLQRAARLPAVAGDWADVGNPAAGTGTGGVAVPVQLVHPDGLTSSNVFYRVKVTSNH